MGRADFVSFTGNLMPKTFRYRVRPIGAPEYTNGQSVLRVGNQEQLTGFIGDKKASDLEERVARSLSKFEIPFEFRARITSEFLGQQRLTSVFANVRGEVEIDHLCVANGRTIPIFVDGSISHFLTAWQSDIDKAKTEIADKFGERMGWEKSIRIPFWKLIDQTMTDRTIRDELRL